MSIAPNTVLVHTRNIMVKLGHHSRESIIDFIEQSHKLPNLREYYVSLTIEAAFAAALKALSKLKRTENWVGGYIYWQNKNLKNALIGHLVGHLKHADIHVVIKEQKKGRRLKIIRNSDQFLLIFIEKEAFQEIPQQISRFILINLSEEKNYFFAVFGILRKLIPDASFESIFKKFVEHYKGVGSSSGSEYSHIYKNEVVEKNEIELEKIRKEIQILKNKKWYYLSTAFCAVLFFFMFHTFKGNKEMQIGQGHKKLKEPSIRSDLFVPTESVLLHRPDEMARIEEKFKGEKRIQTIALVGPGGIGKTTITRQYAHPQKAKVIWEINAETYESLKSSFEDLAQALAITAKDQKILAGLQDTKNFIKREKKLIEFVKKSLKSYSDWFLIYDNVKEFQDIQKYFPQDAETWGQGKIILTTRNCNTQYNKNIHSAIQITELNPNQKLTLFIKIMANGNESSFTMAQREEAKQFLEKIPPFPLDVSTAAYYLKATLVSYDKYLKYLGKGNIDFEKTRENILKEAANYKKTRYHIVILSLKQLMEAHKDFADLLLFICLLDSQDIPRELLDFYKDEVIISDFIYHLKKYSLITDKHPQSLLSGKTISLHKSTQEIGLTYLTKLLVLEKKPHWYQEFSTILEKYSADAIDKEDLPKMNLLITHCESFLKHTHLLTSQTRETLRGELGGMYFYTGHYPKAKKILEESLAYFNKNKKEHTFRVAHILIYLSHIYNQLAEYGKAKQLLEKSLLIYTKSKFQDHSKVAQLLANLGRLEGALFNIEKSRDLLEQSLSLYKEKCPTSQLKRAEVLISLGNVYRELGDYTRAKESLEKSLLFFREHYPETHIKNAGALTRLGNVYRSLGQYNKAKELLEESLSLYRKTYPENHSSIAWISTHLGNIYNKLGNHEKAKSLLEQSHFIYKTYFNENHIANAWVLIHLGGTYKALGDNEKAKAALEKGYDIYKAHNLQVSWPAAHLGNFYREIGQYGKAKEFLNQSFVTYKKHNPHPDIRLALILRYLGSFHRDLEDYKSAKIFFEESRDIYVKIQRKDTMEIALVLWDLGKVTHLEGNLEIATNLIKKALDIFQSNAHPDAYLVSEDLSEMERQKKLKTENNEL